MEIPLFDIKEQHLAIEGELKEAFARVLESGQYILGEEVRSFEEKIAAMAGTEHAIGVSSGTDALLLALMSLGIGPGDDVICPSFTFFATGGCISRVGARPVFVDSCPACFNLDPGILEIAITRNTRAIMVVHLFGQACAMDDIMRIAGRHDLAVIEDAAQSLGAAHNGRPLGSFGAFGAFSFFPTKNLGAIGDAGMLVTNDGDLARRARILRNHGAEPKYHHQAVGGNFRIDALQAALLSVKLPHYDAYTEARRRNAEHYTKELLALDGVRVSTPCRGCASPGGGGDSASCDDARILLPWTLPGNYHIWNQYTLRVRGDGRRDALREYLRRQGIGSEIYYPVPLHRQECFRAVVDSAAKLANAEQIAAECLSLPIYPEVGAARLLRVASAIEQFLAS